MKVWRVRFVHRDPVVGSDFVVLGVPGETAEAAIRAACLQAIDTPRADYVITATEDV